VQVLAQAATREYTNHAQKGRRRWCSDDDATVTADPGMQRMFLGRNKRSVHWMPLRGPIVEQANQLLAQWRLPPWPRAHVLSLS